MVSGTRPCVTILKEQTLERFSRALDGRSDFFTGVARRKLRDAAAEYVCFGPRRKGQVDNDLISLAAVGVNRTRRHAVLIAAAHLARHVVSVVGAILGRAGKVKLSAVRSSPSGPDHQRVRKIVELGKGQGTVQVSGAGITVDNYAARDGRIVIGIMRPPGTDLPLVRGSLLDTVGNNLTGGFFSFGIAGKDVEAAS